MEIRREPYGSAVARPLTDALNAELLERYDGVGGFGSEPPASDFEPPDGAFVVAAVAGRSVGCGGVCRYDGRTAELRRMYVAPDARGNGVSRALLAALEAEARSLGYLALRLETGDRQHEAIGLYSSAGYSRIPRYGPYADDPRSICFEKEL